MQASKNKQLKSTTRRTGARKTQPHAQKPSISIQGFTSKFWSADHVAIQSDQIVVAILITLIALSIIGLFLGFIAKGELDHGLKELKMQSISGNNSLKIPFQFEIATQTMNFSKDKQ